MTEGATVTQLVVDLHAQREGGLTVLVVDDNEADLFLIHAALKRNPMITEIVTARDGQEALELIKRDKVRPHVAILDLRMPRMDGFRVLTELAGRKPKRFQTIVLTSSKADSDITRAKLRGADCFVTKSTTVEELAYDLTQAITHQGHGIRT